MSKFKYVFDVYFPDEPEGFVNQRKFSSGYLYMALEDMVEFALGPYFPKNISLNELYILLEHNGLPKRTIFPKERRKLVCDVSPTITYRSALKLIEVVKTIFCVENPGKRIVITDKSTVPLKTLEEPSCIIS